MPDSHTEAPDQQPEIGEFDDRFDAEIARLSHSRAQLVLLWAPIIYLAFSALDVLVQPDRAGFFFTIRLLVAACCAVLLVLVRSNVGARLATPAVIAAALLGSAGISFMASRLQGFADLYFVGNVISINAIVLLMPWSGLVSLAVGVLITAIYVVFNLQAGWPAVEMVEPVAFLLGTTAFAVLTSLGVRQTLRRNLSLRVRLENANEELKELDEAKTRFFANVSHELRTPLTLILGPLESLTDRFHDSDTGRLLMAMKSNARRLLRQVDAVLDVAKLESGKLRLELAEGNLGQVAHELLDGAQGAAERKEIALVRENLDRVPDGEFDVEKVWIILGNLLSNALKFTERGSITVRARAAGDDVELQVVDTGPGIPADALPHIFDRFYQVDSSSSRQHPGTGIGLALARELAELHGGTLEAASLVGQGTTFTLRMPLQPVVQADRRQGSRRKEDRFRSVQAETRAAQALAQRRASTALADLVEPQLEPPLPITMVRDDAPTVLLADDNDDVRNYLAHELAERFHVVTAADGLEALAILQTRHIDVVVSDIMMPRLSGENLLHEIRKDAAIANVPVILVTAKAASEDVVRGLLEGANDYVTKPFIVAEIEARITAQLRARDAEARMNEQTSRLAAIGQMSSAVAHDVRNAVTVVQGYTELARRANRDAQLDGPLAEVLKAAERLTRMTQEVLDVARGGTPHLQLEDVAVRDFLERTLQPLGMDLKRRGIELLVDLNLNASDVAPLDRDRVTRVIENLLRNAREALAKHDGERRVRVSAHAPAGELVLGVADSGPGIAAGQEQLVFHPFHSGKGSSGLGLATVRNIVLAHGGNVSVIGHGEEGGATFFLKFPLRTAAAAPAKKREPSGIERAPNWTYTH